MTDEVVILDRQLEADDWYDQKYMEGIDYTRAVKEAHLSWKSAPSLRHSIKEICKAQYRWSLRSV